MPTEVTAIYGDCEASFRGVMALVDQLGAQIVWDEPRAEASWEDMLSSVQRTKLALVGHQAVAGDRTILPPSVRLRDEIGVFAQHRPIRPLEGIPCRADDADIIVIRETTEGVYAHLEHESIPGVFESLKVTTRAACERIAEHAFETARRQGRASVTIVHKANIMKRSDGMFLEVARGVGEAYPEIETKDCIVDALCMRVVLWPGSFDVLLCGNLFGDIVGDLAAGLVGGPSNAPSINHATDGSVLFTAGHGTGACNTEQANPLPVLLPAIHLLRHIGQEGAGTRLEQAIAATLTSGTVPFGLAKGKAPRSEFLEAIASRL